MTSMTYKAGQLEGWAVVRRVLTQLSYSICSRLRMGTQAIHLRRNAADYL